MPNTLATGAAGIFIMGLENTHGAPGTSSRPRHIYFGFEKIPMGSLFLGLKNTFGVAGTLSRPGLMLHSHDLCSYSVLSGRYDLGVLLCYLVIQTKLCLHLSISMSIITSNQGPVPNI